MDSFKLLKPDLGIRDVLGVPRREAFSFVHRKCPKCGKRGYGSRPKGKYETYVLPVMLRRPLRCQGCRSRFYSFDLAPTTLKQAALVLGIVAVAAYCFWTLITGFLGLNIKLDFFK